MARQIIIFVLISEWCKVYMCLCISLLILKLM